MKHNFMRLILALMTYCVCGSASAFSITMNAEDGTPGEKAQSKDCRKGNESTFTSDAGRTFYTADESFSGSKSLELNVTEGSRGFGKLGGIIDLPKCTHADGRKLVKGDDIWIRLRLKFPVGFEFNPQGRNKFLRLRTYHNDNGVRKSEGYNDLYINSPPGRANPDGGYSPYHYIFEGAAQWYRAGTISDFFKLGQWNTIEYHVRLDDKKASEGGNPIVQVWYNGKLIGETSERITLKRSDSYVQELYLFTYWGNYAAHKSQKFYVDDFVMTSDKPTNRDAHGNPFIGVGKPPVTAQPTPSPASPPVPPNIKG